MRDGLEQRDVRLPDRRLWKLQLAEAIDPLSQARIAAAEMSYRAGGHGVEFSPNVYFEWVSEPAGDIMYRSP